MLRTKYVTELDIGQAREAAAHHGVSRRRITARRRASGGLTEAGWACGFPTLT